MNAYRQFVMMFLGISSALLLLVVFINFYEDPSDHYHSLRLVEIKFTNYMLHKKNMAVARHINERIVQKIMLTELKSQPDVLVLGSSRAMPINRHLFKGSSFYNASVSGASLQDDIVYYYLYHQRGWKPKTVVLGLDPWILNKNNGQQSWKDLELEYRRGVELVKGSYRIDYLEKLRWNIDKYLQLLSWVYLKASLENIHTASLDVQSYDETKYVNSTYNLKLFDGTLVRSRDMEFKSSEDVRKEGIQFAQQVPIYNLGKFQELDPEYKDTLEKFVAYLIKNNINVIFYLPPYEPDAYEIFNKMKEYKMVNVAEEYFTSLAIKYDIKVVGSYNPAKLHLQSSDFIDGMHMKFEGTNKVFGLVNDNIYDHIHIDYWVG